jgi:hypothetical protein
VRRGALGGLLRAVGIEPDAGLEPVVVVERLIEETNTALDRATSDRRLEEAEAAALRAVLLADPACRQDTAATRRQAAATHLGLRNGEGFRSHRELDLLERFAEVLTPSWTRSGPATDLHAGADAAYPLPPLTAAVHAGSLRARPQPSEADAAVAAWLAGDAGLLVVMGDPGAGTSTLLRTVAASARRAGKVVVAAEVPGTGDDEPTGPGADAAGRNAGGGRRARVDLYVVDDIDTPVGPSATPPDLRDLRPLLAGGSRVAIATHRVPSGPPDPLLAQLADPDGLAALGVAGGVHVVRLEPWTWDALRDAIGGLDVDAGLRRALLAGARTAARHDLAATPLAVAMLFDLARAGDDGARATTLVELVGAHVALAASRPQEEGLSSIAGELRTDILVDVAEDMFFGRGEGGAAGRSSTSAVRLGTRVLERVLDPSVVAHAKRDHDWIADFVATTHAIHAVPGHLTGAATAGATGVAGREPSDPPYRFRHPVFQQLHVARAVLRHVAVHEAPGVELAHVPPEATFDALLLPFLEGLAGAEADDEDLRTLVGRPRLGWVDRVLLVHLLEDRPGFGATLAALPRHYLDELEQFAAAPSHVGIHKLALYQLVVAGRADAARYLDLVRATEDRRATALARRLRTARPRPPADVLIDRLWDDDLRAAAPITLVRLGQLGSQRALGEVERYAKEHPERRADCDAAVAALEARLRGPR